MERYLKKGDTLQMNDGGKYVIAEMIGRGSSCAVYRAEHYKDGIQTEHLLKEYNPLLIDLWRSEDDSLHPSDADRNAFEVGMLRFQAGYEKQLSIRRISGLRNSTSNVQAVFDANGTRYIDMTLFTGSTYSKVQEKSLHELCKRMKAVTQVIGYYHKAGFLHLDIKPDNIFTLPETCELVMLFDFDSVTEKTAVQSGSSLSCTKAWAAPEQIASTQRKHICEATDLYAIGEMMFFRIFGRHSATEERRSFFEYQFDTEADIFKNTNPKVFPLLSELLHHTVTTAVSNRYTSADELIAALDELIKLSVPKEPYLVSTNVTAKEFFIGRDHELQQIHKMLSEGNILYLYGMGGIGKSELARNYVNRHLKDYDTVFFTTYTSSWMTLLTDDYNVQIANYHSCEGEKPEDYFARKLHKLKDLCNERTLFVIDNVDEDEYDEIENECFRQIMELPCRFLFTSRLHEWNQPMLEIGVLTDRNDLVTLFDQWCHIKDDEQRNAVKEIIDYVDCHTLTLELIAKQTTAGFTTPAKMLVKLQEHGMHSSGKEKVKSDKDLTVTKKTAFEHICDLFDMAELTDGEKYVMANMALIPSMGVDAHLFMDWCEIEDADDINSLIAKGWIDRDEDMIMLHPIIREVAQQYGYGFDLGDTVMLKNATVYLTEQFLSFSPTEKRHYADFAVEMATVLMAANLRTDNVGVFLCDVSCQYKDYRNPGIIIDYVECARDIFSGLYGDEHRDTVKSLYSLGPLYLEKGDLDTALQYCEQALIVCRKLFGDESSDTAKSLNNLSMLYLEKGNLDTALQYCEQALAIFRKLYGNEHPMSVLVFENLGLRYRDKGDLDTALQYCEQALSVRRTLYGDEHPQTAQSLLNLGVLYSEKGELARALQYTEQALSVCRKIFGDEHPYTAAALNNLGLRYEENGDTAKALQYGEQALTVFRKLYGDENPNTARALIALGGLYIEKDLDTALQYLEQARSIFCKCYGDENSFMAEFLDSLGELYSEKGDLDTALQYSEQALTVYRKLYGEEHPDTAQVLHDLGVLYGEKGDLETALQHYERALTIREKLFGHEHQKTVEITAKINEMAEKLHQHT